MKNIVVLTIASVLASISLCSAEERPGHFKGKESPTLEVALTNLTTSNARLRVLLETKTLQAKELVEIHELSYTVENALAKLAEEQARLAALMEEVHLASESGDAKKVQTSGAAYLKAAKPWENSSE